MHAFPRRSTEEQSPDGRQQRGARTRLVKGRFRRKARDIAGEQLAHAGLGDKTSSYPKALSGDQQQRLAIARAFAKSVIEEIEAPSEIFGRPKSEHLKEFLANSR